MSTPVDDASVDRIGIGWIGGREGPFLVRADLSVDDERARRVLVAFVEARPDWDDLALMARCIASQRSCSTDDRSVTFASEHYGNAGSLYLADGTEDQVEVGDAAGRRLLARWLRTIVDGAEGERLEITGSSSWPEFVRDVEAVEAQISST
jgi:hypothetical protein